MALRERAHGFVSIRRSGSKLVGSFAKAPCCRVPEYKTRWPCGFENEQAGRHATRVSGSTGATAKSETSDGSLLEVPVAAPGAAG